MILLLLVKSLVFLYYFATSRLDVDLAENVIKVIVDGCKQSECALLGGETAEMLDFYAEDEYDLSGVCSRKSKERFCYKQKKKKNIVAGDILFGFPSNGFSIVRRVMARSNLLLSEALPGGSSTHGEALMAPSVIYVKRVIRRGGVKGIAHITSGCFTDNILRVFPDGLSGVIHTNAWVLPPLFKWIQQVENHRYPEWNGYVYT